MRIGIKINDLEIGVADLHRIMHTAITIYNCWAYLDYVSPGVSIHVLGWRC